MNRVLVPTLDRPLAASHGDMRRLSGQTMGTTWSVQAVLPEGLTEGVVRVWIEAVFTRIISQMSAWEPASELSRFNAAPVGARLAIGDDFRKVLSASLEIARDTDGAFDPTFGVLTDLWGFGARPVPPGLPPPDRLEAALAQGGWRRLVFDRGVGEIVQPGGLALDVNGVAKGHAVDQVGLALRAEGIAAFLVEIGGELRGEGVKPDGLPWWVQLEEPPQTGPAQPPLVVALHGLSIATSGDYRRSFDLAGKAYAHTLDPRTGRPCETGLASVSVLHADCLSADAYATALTVMGQDAGMALAVRLDLAARFLVRTPEGLREALSPAMARMLDA